MHASFRSITSDTENILQTIPNNKWTWENKGHKKYMNRKDLIQEISFNINKPFTEWNILQNIQHYTWMWNTS